MSSLEGISLCGYRDRSPSFEYVVWLQRHYVTWEVPAPYGVFLLFIPSGSLLYLHMSNPRIRPPPPPMLQTPCTQIPFPHDIPVGGNCNGEIEVYSSLCSTPYRLGVMRYYYSLWWATTFNQVCLTNCLTFTSSNSKLSVNNPPNPIRQKNYALDKENKTQLHKI